MQGGRVCFVFDYRSNFACDIYPNEARLWPSLPGVIMPSLTPQKPFTRSSEIDLIETFKGELAAKTRERVIDYLWPIYRDFSDLDVEKVWSKTTIHEEFYIPMPTNAAYFAELDLCKGILEHARGEIGDAVMLVLLREFVECHTWIYHPDGPRKNKRGNWPDWARVQLYTLTFSQAEPLPYFSKEIICNSMQAWFIRLLEERRGASGFRLEKL